MGTLFEELKEGLEQVALYLDGKLPDVRVRVFEPNEIQQLRAKAGLTQSQFAEMIGASIGTVRKWEQGLRKPSGAAKTLLRIVAHRPSIVREALGVEPKAALRRPRRAA
jgi:putative transcriptional regulator